MIKINPFVRQTPGVLTFKGYTMNLKYQLHYILENTPLLGINYFKIYKKFFSVRGQPKCAHSCQAHFPASGSISKRSFWASPYAHNVLYIYQTKIFIVVFTQYTYIMYLHKYRLGRA